MRFIRYPRAPRRALATLISSAVFVAIGVPIWAANASTGVLSSVSQAVVSDGTAPFDSSSAAGFDTGASNSIIRTHDSFILDWTYIVATPGDVTFRETLVNGFWDSSSAGACLQGASAISADKKTITCTLTNLSVGSGSYRVQAIADGAAAHGSTISGVVSAGAAQSTSLALSVSAAPKMNIGTMDLFPVVSSGPGSSSTTTGYYFDVPISMWADVTGSFNGTSGVRGLESLASPITFSAEPLSPQALLVSCGSGAAGGTRPAYPDASGGNGTTILNAVRNAGTWTCTQPSAGAPVAVTVTGADSSLNSYPTKSANNSAITSNRAYFSDGYVRLWVPKTATTPNTTTSFTTRITQFDPISTSGVSNFATGFAPNQPDPGSCSTGAYQNCSTVVVNRVPQAVRPDVRVEDASMGSLPGSSVAWDGLGQVTANTQFYTSLLSSVPVSNEAMTNVTMCLKWNPALSQIDTSKPIGYSAGGLTATIEYSSTQYSSLPSYQAADCGRPGTGSNWFSTVAAAGGAGAVSAVRITFNGVLNSGASMSADIPRTVSPGLAAGTFIGFFGSLSSAETNELGSTYNPETGSGFSGSRVVNLEARTGVSIAWDTSTSSVPAVREVTVTPRLLAGQTARDTRVVATLPSACFEYVQGSASISPSSITPANVGPDGVACTGDDVAPARLEFAFGDLSASPAPITFRVNIASGIAVPSNQVVSATVSSPSDPATSAVHSASATLAVAAVAGFSLAKTADTGRVSEGVPFNYSINWRNGSATQNGGVKIVDVFPFAGDSRGSSGFTGLAINSVSLPTGAAVEYSSLDSASALALADSHPDGEDATFAWTSVKPTHATAIRIVIANLPAMTSGTATVNVTATGVQAGGKLKNDLYGVASFASAPIKAAVPLEIQTLGTASLAVSKTANLSEITAAGQILRYTIRVTNTGQEALSSVSVSDHNFTGLGAAPTITCPGMVLSAGATMDCETLNYSVTQAEIDTLPLISNEVTAIGTPPAGAVVSATDSVATPVRASSGLTLTQIPSPNSLSQAGSVVTYMFTVTNAGTRSLSGLSVHVDSFNGSATPAAITCASTNIAPNSSVTCSTTYAVTQHDLDTLSALLLRGSATAVDMATANVTSNTTQTTVPLTRQPALTLAKSAAVASFGGVGESIPFVFTVTNTGNVTLDSVDIVERSFTGTGELGSIACPSTSVAPGSAVTCSVSYLTTQSDFDAGAITNSAKATATFGSTSVNSNESTVTVNAVGVAPGLTVATTTDVEFVAFSGDVIHYSIVVTNTGNVTLTGVNPSISSAGFSGTGTPGALNCPNTTLNPRASMTCTLNYSVNQNDIDSLTRINLGTAVSAVAGTTPVAATALPVSVDVNPIAHLDVAVTPSMSTSTQAGDSIVFTLRLVNDGAFTLSHVVATVRPENFNGHGNLGVVQCPNSLTLAPGQSANCVVHYTVTQSDIDELETLLLTADASGEYLGGSESFNTTIGNRELNDTAEVQLAPRESLSMVKTASLAVLNAAGEQIAYEFEITNLSTRTLYNVAVNEISFSGIGAIGAINCPTEIEEMAPGDSAVCTASYTALPGDMAKTSVRNTASASASSSLSSGARSISALESTATVPVKSSQQFESGDTKSSLTLTGATAMAQLIAGALALVISGAIVIRARSWRRA